MLLLRALRLALKGVGLLLTPLVAWAASFLGATATALLVADVIPSGTLGTGVIAAAGIVAALLALLAWTALLRSRRQALAQVSLPPPPAPPPAAAVVPAFAVAGLAAGCGGGEAPGPRAPADPIPRAAAPAQSLALPDSLALRAPDGTEVWLVSGRTARGADGTACAERLLELRTDGQRTPVPLLYTGERPRLVNDSTIEAHIWRDCAPGNRYRVSLRTGHPVHLK